MEQFNLDKWLQDKSRKVVTKVGEEVKIIDTNAPDKNDPIVGYIYHKQKWNGPWSWHIDGVYKVGGDDMDLFFADEEEELTDFESDLFTAFSDAWQQYLRGESVNVVEWAKEHSKDLLESARKELEKSNVIVDKDKYIKNCDYYYEHGKQDALKSLPKWKKATENKEFDKHVFLFEDEKRVVLTDGIYKGEYYIEIDNLKNLPKKE